MSRPGCPHANIAFCPLYVAAHDGALCGSSCDDGHLDEGGCAVSRGMDYVAAVGRIMAIDARLVAELKWAEEIAESKAQRASNLRLAGIH